MYNKSCHSFYSTDKVESPPYPYPGSLTQVNMELTQVIQNQVQPLLSSFVLPLANKGVFFAVQYISVGCNEQTWKMCFHIHLNTEYDISYLKILYLFTLPQLHIGCLFKLSQPSCISTIFFCHKFHFWEQSPDFFWCVFLTAKPKSFDSSFLVTILHPWQIRKIFNHFVLGRI